MDETTCKFVNFYNLFILTFTTVGVSSQNLFLSFSVLNRVVWFKKKVNQDPNFSSLGGVLLSNTPDYYSGSFLFLSLSS